MFRTSAARSLCLLAVLTLGACASSIDIKTEKKPLPNTPPPQRLFINFTTATSLTFPASLMRPAHDETDLWGQWLVKGFAACGIDAAYRKDDPLAFDTEAEKASQFAADKLLRITLQSQHGFPNSVQDATYKIGYGDPGQPRAAWTATLTLNIQYYGNLGEKLAGNVLEKMQAENLIGPACALPTGK